MALLAEQTDEQLLKMALDHVRSRKTPRVLIRILLRISGLGAYITVLKLTMAHICLLLANVGLLPGSRSTQSDVKPSTGTLTRCDSEESVTASAAEPHELTDNSTEFGRFGA